MRIAKECGRKALGYLLGFAVASIFATSLVHAQTPKRSLFGGNRPAAANRRPPLGALALPCSASAGEIQLSHAFDGCQLATLSACESGNTGLG